MRDRGVEQAACGVHPLHLGIVGREVGARPYPVVAHRVPFRLVAILGRSPERPHHIVGKAACPGPAAAGVPAAQASAGIADRRPRKGIGRQREPDAADDGPPQLRLVTQRDDQRDSAVVCTGSANRTARNGSRASPNRTPHAVRGSPSMAARGGMLGSVVLGRPDGGIVDGRHRECQRAGGHAWLGISASISLSRNLSAARA